MISHCFGARRDPKFTDTSGFPFPLLRLNAQLCVGTNNRQTSVMMYRTGILKDGSRDPMNRFFVPRLNVDCVHSEFRNDIGHWCHECLVLLAFSLPFTYPLSSAVLILSWLWDSIGQVFMPASGQPVAVCADRWPNSAHTASCNDWTLGL